MRDIEEVVVVGCARGSACHPVISEFDPGPEASCGSRGDLAPS